MAEDLCHKAASSCPLQRLFPENTEVKALVRLGRGGTQQRQISGFNLGLYSSQPCCVYNNRNPPGALNPHVPLLSPSAKEPVSAQARATRQRFATARRAGARSPAQALTLSPHLALCHGELPARDLDVAAQPVNSVETPTKSLRAPGIPQRPCSKHSTAAPTSPSFSQGAIQQDHTTSDHQSREEKASVGSRIPSEVLLPCGPKLPRASLWIAATAGCAGRTRERDSGGSGCATAPSPATAPISTGPDSGTGRCTPVRASQEFGPGYKRLLSDGSTALLSQMQTELGALEM